MARHTRRLPFPSIPSQFLAVPEEAEVALRLAVSDCRQPRLCGQTLEWARRLRIVPRILARHPHLLDTVEPLDREELQRAQRVTVASGLLRLEASHRLRAIAEANGIDMLFLKGTALIRQEIATVESRFSSDIDVLVPPDHAEALYTVLREQGFQELELERWTNHHHHLRPLGSDWCGSLEIHRWLPGVGTEGTFEELRALGLIANEGQDQLTRTGLGVHAIAHLLFQERWNPWTGLLGPTLGDLDDLAFGTSQRSLQTALSKLPRVDADRIRGLLDLLEELRSGTSPEPSSSSGLLLRSTLAAAELPEYRRSLRRRAFLEAVINGDLHRMARGVGGWLALRRDLRLSASDRIEGR